MALFKIAKGTKTNFLNESSSTKDKHEGWAYVTDDEATHTVGSEEIAEGSFYVDVTKDKRVKINGHADIADALSSDVTVGNSIKPVFFRDGVPTQTEGQAIPLVLGTQTASTNIWTGELVDDQNEAVEPYDGMMIKYYLPYAGTSTNATLQLSGGAAAPVYRYGTSTAITTHFAAGSIISMTYRINYNVAGTNKPNGAWIVDAYYDSNDSAAYVYANYNRIKAGSRGIKQYSLIMETADGTWESLTTDSGTGTKTRNSRGFKLGKIYYYNGSSNIAGGGTIAETHEQRHNVNLRYSFNISATDIVPYKNIYLVGTFKDSDGLFYLDESWWTQTEPTTEDGKIYIYLGVPYNTANDYRMQLLLDKPMYKYYNNAFRLWTPLAEKAIALTTSDVGDDLSPVYFKEGVPVQSIGQAIPFIKGTHTSEDSIWTGELHNTNGESIDVYDGLMIKYYIPYDTNQRDIQLQLNDGDIYPVYNRSENEIELVNSLATIPSGNIKDKTDIGPIESGGTSDILSGSYFSAGSILNMTFVQDLAENGAWVIDSNNTVNQVETSIDKEYALLAKYHSNSSGLSLVGTVDNDYTRYTNSVTLNPHNHSITAAHFIGPADYLNEAKELSVNLSNNNTDTFFDGQEDLTDIKVTGTLAVANGGTGNTSFTKNQIITAGETNLTSSGKTFTTSISSSSTDNQVPTAKAVNTFVADNYIKNITLTNDGSAPKYNLTRGGAADKNTTVNLPVANATNAGVVTTGTQTFTGSKTIDTNGSLTVNGSLTAAKSNGFIFSGIANASSTTNADRQFWVAHGSTTGIPVLSGSSLTFNSSTGALSAANIKVTDTTDTAINNSRFDWGNPSNQILPTQKAIKDSLNNIIASLAGGMTYKGTVDGTNGLPAKHNAGDVYVVAAAGTYAGKAAQVGDLIICKTARTTANNADWEVITKGSHDGTVFGPESNGENELAMFDGTTGRLLKGAALYKTATALYPSSTASVYLGIETNPFNTIYTKGPVRSYRAADGDSFLYGFSNGHQVARLYIEKCGVAQKETTENGMSMISPAVCGIATLTLGNNLSAVDNDDNALGRLRLYSNGSYYVQLQPHSSDSVVPILTANRTVYFPDKTGYLVLTPNSSSVGSATKPVYVNGGTVTACSSSLTDYLPLTGGTINGNLAIKRTSDTYGTLNIGDYLQLRTDSEGGNIRIFGPANTHYWETDAIGNTSLRFYCHDMSANTDTFPFKIDSAGSISIRGGAWPGLIYGLNSSGKRRYAFYSNSSTGAIAGVGLDVYTKDDNSTCENFFFQTSGNIDLNGTTRGIRAKDSAGNFYHLICDNGSNLWIGSLQTAAKHHVGATYISAGWNSNTSKGNDRIYLSVPNDANNSATNYELISSKGGQTIAGLTLSAALKITQKTGNFYNGIDIVNGNVSTGVRVGAFGANTLNNDTSNTGTFYAVLGNNTSVGTAGNAQGILRIYDTNTYYCDIKGRGDLTANRYLYFPNAGGWLVVGGNGSTTGCGSSSRPVYLSTAGVITACGTALEATQFNANQNTAGENNLKAYHKTGYLSLWGNTSSGTAGLWDSENNGSYIIQRAAANSFRFFGIFNTSNYGTGNPSGGSNGDIYFKII